METPIFISRLLAALYLAVGLGMLGNAKYYRAIFNDLKERASLVFYGGILALVTGYLLVSFHPSLQPNLYLPITVLGWLALAKGVVLLIYPQMLVKVDLLTPLYYLKALLALALGAYFTWLGFFR